jgi:hypothetical protein
MIYIDVKHINLCASKLRNFKKNSSGAYNCSCPICGDSDTQQFKARGYFLTKGAMYWYHCHNCGISLSFKSFLKKVFPVQYQEYIFEKYKDIKQIAETIKADVPVVSSLKKISLLHSIPINKLSKDHAACTYLRNRMIPEDKLHLLYYTTDFAALVEEMFPGQYSKLQSKDARIVIPFFDATGNVTGLQGRTLNNSDNGRLRYITIRADKSIALIYGIDRLDFTKKILVVEGPLDSLFLPNAIAVASSDLQRSLKVFPNIRDYILVFDNEPRNSEIVKLVVGAIENNRTVCIWPTLYSDKDINDMVLSGHKQEDIIKDIIKNSFSGLKAKIKLTEWRKC